MTTLPTLNRPSIVQVPRRSTRNLPSGRQSESETVQGGLGIVQVSCQPSNATVYPALFLRYRRPAEAGGALGGYLQ